MPLRVLIVRNSVYGNYKLSAWRAHDTLMMALRKSLDIKEIWIVTKGDFSSDRLGDDVDYYNVFKFSDGIDVINRFCPDLILLYGGDYEYIDRAILKASISKGIPTVDVLSSGFDFDEVLGSKKYEKRKVLGRLYALRTNGINIAKRYLFLLRTLVRAKYSFYYIIQTITKDIYLPFISWSPRYRFGGGDLNIVSTPQWAEILERYGINRDKIAVTGDIGMDSIFHKLNGLPGKIINNEADKTLEILLITNSMVEHGHWTPTMREKLLNSVIRTIRLQLENKSNLRLKIHPTSERMDTYRQLIDSIDPSIEIIQDADLLLLIDECDIVITYGITSALFEPLLLCKPIFILNFFDDETSKNIFIKNKIAIECKTPQELVSYIKSKVYPEIDPNKKEAFLKSQIYVFDGKCSERAADHIIHLLEQKSNKPVLES